MTLMKFAICSRRRFLIKCVNLKVSYTEFKAQYKDVEKTQETDNFHIDQPF